MTGFGEWWEGDRPLARPISCPTPSPARPLVAGRTPKGRSGRGGAAVIRPAFGHGMPCPYGSKNDGPTITLEKAASLGRTAAEACTTGLRSARDQRQPKDADTEKASGPRYTGCPRFPQKVA